MMENEGQEVNKDDLEPLWMRLINMVIVWIMLSFASSLLGLMTIAQFVVMLVNQRKPNEQLAEMGTTLGVWMAKAARYQTGASEVKPWPWTTLD
ncbi:DUF4389 domain-containing protein [Yoonia sp. R2331]|uniref:DUF4389 domain-containing protein n=1 Tax=Yoonia sp. R2331 TaxID=3237238 RepID=UPI0034E593CF